MGLSTPPNSPGHTRVFWRGSGPTSFRCRPTGCSQTRSWVSRSQAIDPAGLAGAEDHRPTIRPDGREDRRDLEVVVADVVVEHLVVPDDLAGGAVQDDQRVGVERAAGEPGAVREPRRAAPRARVRDADVDTALRVDRHRVPRPTPAGVGVRPGLRDRLEPPDPASRPGVERVDGSAPAGREADGREVRATAIDDGGDVDELLGLARETSWSRDRLPVRASRANAVVSVAASTRPPTTATPFGPSFGAVVSRDHRTRPVRRSSATTSDFQVWR